MSANNKSKDRSGLLAVLLIVIAIFFLAVGLDHEGGQPKKAPQSINRDIVKTQSYENAVNRNLMMTNENIEIQKKKIEVENYRFLNKELGTKDSNAKNPDEQGVTLHGENSAAEIAEMLGRGERKEQITTPEDLIQKELFSQQQQEELTQAYKEEYARQFVENARRGGYKVILSSDLSRVISVKPIREPTQSFEVFKDFQSPPNR